MTVEKRLEKLIEQGGVIGVLFSEGTMVEVTLAAAIWQKKPTRLRWCGIFPEHQGHIHTLHYTRVTTDNDGRDLVFYNGDRIVAVVVPYIESNLNTDEVRAALSEWRAEQAVPGQAATLLEFLTDA